MEEHSTSEQESNRGLPHCSSPVERERGGAACASCEPSAEVGNRLRPPSAHRDLQGPPPPGFLNPGQSRIISLSLEETLEGKGL